MTHVIAGRSLLLMCAHAPVFCSTTTTTRFLDGSAGASRKKRQVYGASSSCALHLGRHVVQHRRRLGSSAPPDPEYKCNQLGSVIYSSNFVFFYLTLVLFCGRSQVDEQRGLTYSNFLHRSSCSPINLFLQSSFAFSLSDSIHLHFSMTYKVNSVPTYSLLCKYYIIFV